MYKDLIKEYEINPRTLMLKPIIKENKILTEIFEEDANIVISTNKPLKIIKDNCSYFGTDYNGRVSSAKEMLGVDHKPPIIIDPHIPLCFFPTVSPSQPHCIWIAFEQVLDHKASDYDNTIVIFYNKAEFEIPVSYNSFRNQYQRTAVLRFKYEQNLRRKGYDMPMWWPTFMSSIFEKQYKNTYRYRKKYGKDEKD